MKKLIIFLTLAFLILLQSARADITIDKETYTPGETINIRLSSANNLIEVAIFITNPRGTQEIFETSVVNNQVWEYDYTLETNAVNGTYVINMIASEGGSLSENSTKFYFSKNFDVVTSSSFSADPDVINETVSEITENTIYFENFGDSDVNISEIIVLGDIIGVVSIVERPYVISPNSREALKIRIDPSYLPNGSYNGTISVLSDRGVIPIYVYLEVTSNPSLDIGDIQDYSFIIWTFAIFIVVVIVAITILRYSKIRKKKSQEKKKIDEEKNKEEVYYKLQEEYRTEYY